MCWVLSVSVPMEGAVALRNWLEEETGRSPEGLCERRRGRVGSAAGSLTSSSYSFNWESFDRVNETLGHFKVETSPCVC